jgi:hypothetical protein
VLVVLIGAASATDDGPPPRIAATSPAGPAATATPEPPPTGAGPAATPTPEPPPTGDGLAIGITEQNAAFLRPAPRPVAEPFARWRDELTTLAPAYFRLVVDWSSLQPDPAAPPDLARAQTGCLRARTPCAGYAGTVEQLQALAARQAAGGWRTLVAITWTPSWAGSEAGGCEPGDVDPRARPPRADALDDYRALVRALLAAARAAGAELRWWTPWNEPNHPGFISPQRATCDAAAPSAAVAHYVAIARALQAELDAAPGDQRLALGELAGLLTRTPGHTAVDEFIAALPTDLVCAADVWSQHAYVGGDDPVDAVHAALTAHGCARTPAIWITETGAREASCAALQRRLERWHADPRVGAAFQYTLREDDRFRTGLVRSDLSAARSELAVWQAWGRAARPAPTDPPAPSAC